MRNQSPADVNFWTPQDKIASHAAIAELHKKPQIPDGDCPGYQHERPHLPLSYAYILTAEEEWQLKDDIAFPTPSGETPLTVTASAVEEHYDGNKLVLRLGVNEESKSRAPAQLRDILQLCRSMQLKVGT